MKTVEADRVFIGTKRSFKKYASRCLKIQTMEGDLVNCKLNEIQLILEKIIEHIRQSLRLIRILVLKARREGVSTWVAGRFFWKTTGKPNMYSMVITHEPEATDFLFNMQKRFYDHLPIDFVPEQRYNNKKELQFNNTSGTGLDSAIRVGTAGKEDFGSGQLIHFLHLSELAKYPKHTQENLLTAILQCVPDNPLTEIIMESTGKGIDGQFYSRFWDARYRYIIFMGDDGDPDFRVEINEEADPDNEYSSIFIPWFAFSKYQRDVPNEFVLNTDERQLKAQHNLTDRQLAWRRWAIANKCNGNVDMFNQEYPSKPEDAFIISQGVAFPEISKKIHGIDENNLTEEQFKRINDVFDFQNMTPREGTHKFRSFDWGHDAPFSVGYWFTDKVGRLYRYREIYGGVPKKGNVGIGLSDTDIAKKMIEVQSGANEKEEGFRIKVADASIWDRPEDHRGKNEHMPSIAEIMRRAGVTFHEELSKEVKRKHSRISGKAQLHERFRIKDDGLPSIFIFNTCKDWWRTVPYTPKDELNPEDVDTDSEDHAYDETRYMCMSRPMKVEEPEKRPHPLQLDVLLKKKDESRRLKRRR